MGREPPKRTPPLFKVGDYVEVRVPNSAWLSGKVTAVNKVSADDLVRYAYCFFWTYGVRFTDRTDGPFSENVLRLRLIEQLGSLVDLADG